MVRSPTGLAPSPFLPVKAYRVVRLVCAKAVLVMSSVRQAVKIIPAVGRLALLQDRNVEKRARREEKLPGKMHTDSPGTQGGPRLSLCMEFTYGVASCQGNIE